MSDNEAEDQQSESENESEVELNEGDMIEENKDYNSGVDESDDETKEAKVEKPKKIKSNEDEVDEDEVDEDDEIDEIEVDPVLMEKSMQTSLKFGIIVDPRQIAEYTKPNPKMNNEIVVNKLKYKSNEYMSIFEFTDIISARSQHISDGSYIFVEIDSETTARDIAKKELQLGQCPYLIKRYMDPMNYGNVHVEIWNPNEMAIDSKYFNN